MSVELRLCRQGWVFCDGNCEKCITITTSTTTTNSEVQFRDFANRYDPIEIARQYAPKFDKPVVDMVEVVRCKDCKWYSQFTSMTDKLLHEGCCEYHSNYFAEDDFCSRGERKDDTQNG